MVGKGSSVKESPLPTIPPERKIQLTREGHTLIIPRNKKEGDKLVLAPDAIGWLDTNEQEYIGLKPISETENELTCYARCRLHIPVPSSVTTYAELRALFKGRLETP